MQSYPLHSLIEGSWFKLICGASYQHLPAIRSLALAYSLAGADCIDVAADPAVISAAQEGITAAQKFATGSNPKILPWLMVSINDGEDPHFRKAKFDLTQCPVDCHQPCVQVCPASAIDLSSSGVVDAPNVIAYLRSLYELISPLPCPLIWQTDGRSMSGDIGKGTTHMAIALAQKVLKAQLPGYIQLAGGTNDYTVAKLKQSNMLRRYNSHQSNSVSGVAYGSYARAVLSPILNQLDNSAINELQLNQFNLISQLALREKPEHFSRSITNQPMNQFNLKLEQNSTLLEQAVDTASLLVNQIKKQSI